MELNVDLRLFGRDNAGLDMVKREGLSAGRDEEEITEEE